MTNQTAFSTFRRSKQLTLDAVAEMFAVNRTTILRWEKGEVPIPVRRLEEFEHLTGISRRDLRPDIFATGAH